MPLSQAMRQLKRYTELPYVLQILQTRQLTLLNPTSWDDRNDSHFVQAYRERKGLGSVLALCLTEAAQTYHHWRVFTHGASGACLQFNKKRFLDWIAGNEALCGRPVQYKTLRQIRQSPPALDDLPFIKRRAYEHELEFRLLYATQRRSPPFKAFNLPLDTIDSILLNPWLPPSTAKAVESVIHRIDGCESMRILRATIISNDEWQQAATERNIP